MKKTNPIHGFDPFTSGRVVTFRLKPCPFCGGKARADTESLTVNGKPKEFSFVECLGEDCNVIIRAKTEAQAVKMWQRRAK